MKLVCTLIISCLVLSLALGKQQVVNRIDFRNFEAFERYNESLSQLLRLLQKPQLLTREHRKLLPFTTTVHVKSPVSFSWHNCGSSSDILQINKLSVSPDPVSIPGQVELSFNSSLSKSLSSAIKLDLTIKKKFAFVWIEVPCIDNVGSCDYSDLCSMLPKQCPPIFKEHNIPCNCPLKQGNYALPTSTLDIPKVKVPEFLTEGDYEVTAKLSSSEGSVGCYYFSFSLK